MKLVVMVLLGFELLVIFNEKKQATLLIGSFALTFSPATFNGGSMQHVGDLIFFTIGLMVAFYHYFYQHEKKVGACIDDVIMVIFGL